MSLKLIHTDLTRFPCDAAVLSADENLEYGGSVFGAYRSAGGPSLREALQRTGGCETGKAVSIPWNGPSSRLCCHRLIITAAPFWKDGEQGETELLKSCYQSSLDEAVRHGCKTVGISLIDSGVYGFPKETARETAVQAILDYPGIQDLNVYLVTFDWRGYGDHANRILDLERYINRMMQTSSLPVTGSDFGDQPLEERLKQMDESFSQMLLRRIDEAGIKDSKCYKDANVSKQLFSKIRSAQNYRPKKETVLAFAIALKLNLDDTNALLKTAGYLLTHSNQADIIIEYFISQHIYDVFAINEALFMYDQPTLGSE